MRSRLAVLVVALLVGIGGSVTVADAHTPPPPAPARIRVLVVGESEAGTLATGSPKGQGPHGLVAQPSLVLWDSTLLGCSISTVPVFILANGAPALNQCGGNGHWQQQWTRDVLATKPDVVFVMAGARDLFDVAGPDGTVIHPGDPAWTERYTADVRELFRILGSSGAPVVAVKPTCYGANTLPGGEAQASERLDPARVHAVTAAWTAAARASGLRLLDLDAITCPGGVADPVIRADGVHFTAAGADRLAPVITAALHRAVTAAARRRGTVPRPRSGPSRHG
jgi:lysophospholipase L1-like esterase